MSIIGKLFAKIKARKMNCNILIMGITGVGKSALINYLAGEEIAESGVSSHAGGITRGIHKYSLDINKQPCNVFDTEGLEISNADFWKQSMRYVLFNNSTHLPIRDWYHIVVYCIGANSGRVQPFELEMIGQLIDAGYGVIIAFTKSDTATDEELNILRNTVESHFNHSSQLYYVPVCSVKTRSGFREGKKELSDAVFAAWGKSLIYRLSDYVYSCVDGLDDWYKERRQWIKNQDFGLFGKSNEDVLEELNKSISKKVNYLNDEIKTTNKLANNEISSVLKMLSSVMDTKKMKIEKSDTKAFSTKINDNDIYDNSFEAVGIVTLLIGIVYSKFTSSKRKDAILNAFNEKYKEIKDSFTNQKITFDNKLRIAVGDITGYKAMGQAYLLGKSVPKSIHKAFDCFEKAIKLYGDENDPFLEFYYSYMLYFKGNKQDSDVWLMRAGVHGSTRAKLVLKGVPFREVAENEDYDN